MEEVTVPKPQTEPKKPEVKTPKIKWTEKVTTFMGNIFENVMNEVESEQ